jgi:hypothetical protein
MRRKSQRMMGMTREQIGILGGLTVVALLVICGLLWMVLSASLPVKGVAKQPVAVASPAATHTPKPPTATVEPTSIPTEEPIATLEPLAGWVNYETQGANLWLPGDFIGGDMVKKKKDSAKKVDNLSRIFDKLANDMRAAPPEVVLWMVNKSSTAAPLTTVVVRHKILTEDTDVDRFATDEVNSLNAQVPVINETNKMSLLGHEVRRLIYQGYDVSVEFTEVFYAIKDGSDFWTVAYRMAPGKYMDLLPMINTSIHTFFLAEK